MAAPDLDLESLALDVIIAKLPRGAVVADCGCTNWLAARACRGLGHRVIGLDREEPPGRPEGAEFAVLDGAKASLADDTADLTVLSHVIEHMLDPVAFFAETARITKPGGLLWVEAPSELSTLPRASDDTHDHRFFSFWDDPTHVRPWTPGALYRLALTCRALPLACRRDQRGDIPVVRMLARKPSDIRGRPPTRYVTLEFVPPGIDAAWQAIWGSAPKD